MSRTRTTGHVPRVFLDQPLEAGTRIELSGDRFHHLRNVLRVTVDDPLLLFNGGGSEFPARITGLERRSLTLECGAPHEPAREPPLRIVLGQAAARGDRMDYAIGKAVELGVTAIQPLLTERATLRLNQERSHKKQAHWRRLAISAAEQSGRTVVPTILPPQDLPEWLPSMANGKRLVLDPAQGAPLGRITPPDTPDVALLVGPESGLTQEEIALANAAGFTSTKLGPRTLRTETAGVACLAAIQTLWGDLG